MKMMKSLSVILLLVVATVTLSCDEDEYYEYGDSRFDMVTYLGYDESVGASVFKYLPPEDIPSTILHDAGTKFEWLSIGDRVLLNYEPVATLADGSVGITTTVVVQAITDSLRYVDGRLVETVPMDSIKLNSIWRTGDYINIYSRVKFTNKSRMFYLVMDESTWHEDTVHCYLAHNMMGQTAYFWRRCYGSFCIKAVWNLPSCKVVRVHLNDLNYPEKKYYDFNKQ